jgi:hypothetical protein
MITARRFLVLVLLMFWQGGFTFYASVVVPIGTEVLGSAREQGWITRRVTVWLNVAGLAALAALGWDIAADRDPVRLRRWLRCLTWLLMAASLVGLLWLHERLDSLLDLENLRILSRPTFRAWHRWYLWISTAQWAGGLLALLLMLGAWRASNEKPLAA